MAVAELYWVPSGTKGRLAIAPRPRAGDWLEDEILSWKAAGVQVVVCLLEDHETVDLDLSQEGPACSRHEIDFLRFPIPDRGLPANDQAIAFSRSLAQMLIQGRSVLIHCRAGIGRTGLLASAVLVQLGLEPAQVIAIVGEARRLAIPDTYEQRDWILNLRSAR